MLSVLPLFPGLPFDVDFDSELVRVVMIGPDWRGGARPECELGRVGRGGKAEIIIRQRVQIGFLVVSRRLPVHVAYLYRSISVSVFISVSPAPKQVSSCG